MSDTSTSREQPLFDAVRSAARNHAIATGEFETEAGDFEILFQAAYRLLGPVQRRLLWRGAEVADLLELDEYAEGVVPLLRELIQPRNP